MILMAHTTGTPAKLVTKKPKKPKQEKAPVVAVSLEDYYSTTPIRRDEMKCYLLTKPKK
jgi:hypothetical protein